MSKKDRSSQNADKQNLNQGSQKQSQTGGPSHSGGMDKQKQQPSQGGGGGFANWEKSHEKELHQ